jgi:hypothetical protein
MEALGMIQRQGSRWKTTTANLRMLAVRLGVMDDFLEQISRNRHERAAWHAYLERFLTPQIEETAMFDVERDEYWLPPDDAAIWQAA